MKVIFKSQNHFLRALFSLILFSLILWILGSLFSGSPFGLKLYEKIFSKTGMHWFAGKLSLAKNHPNSCLILGASSALEGFDEDILFNSTGKPFFNGSTTGTIQIYEAMAKIIQRFNIQLNCVIVPLHPWQINEWDFDLNELGFTDLLNYSQIKSYLIHPNQSLFFQTASHEPFLLEANTEGKNKEFLLNTLIPFRHHARILSRHIRSFLHELNSILFKEKALKRSEYEYLSDELKLRDKYSYSEEERLPKEKLKIYVDTRISEGFFDRKNYGRELYLNSLRNTLKILRDHSKNVFIVIMPDSSSLDYPNYHNTKPFFTVLREFQTKNTYCVDFSDLLKDNLFRDLTHPLPTGRKILSQKLSEIINNPMNTCNYKTLNKFKNRPYSSISLPPREE